MVTDNMVTFKVESHHNAAFNKEVAILFMGMEDNMHMETLEDALIGRINTVKNRLANAVQAYYVDCLNNLPVASKLEKLSIYEKVVCVCRRDFYLNQLRFYSNLFQGFSIESFERVVYNETVYEWQEPVRRLTAIHLEALREQEIPNSDEIRILQNEYEMLLEEFLNVVK